MSLPVRVHSFNISFSSGLPYVEVGKLFQGSMFPGIILGQKDALPNPWHDASVVKSVQPYCEMRL